jgi:hypothetical protein
LVEENAASAKSLEQQSQTMDERVSFFRVDDGHAAAASKAAASNRPAASRPQAAKSQPAQAAASQQPADAVKRPPATTKRGPVGRMQAALATAFQGEADWKEF